MKRHPGSFRRGARAPFALYMALARIFLGFLALLFLLFLVFLSLAFYFRFEMRPPLIEAVKAPNLIGRLARFEFKISDHQTGLREVGLIIEQSGKRFELAREVFPAPSARTLWRRGEATEKKLEFDADIQELGLKEGPARLLLLASDHSFYNFFKGNEAKLEKNLRIDLTPPRIQVLSREHYINQGGSEALLYSVSPDAESSGVRVSLPGSNSRPLFFPGCPVAGAPPNTYISLFAVPHDVPPDVEIKAVARDAAGNESSAGFFYKLFPKRFATERMQITETFLRAKMPEFIERVAELPRDGDLLKTFLAVNGPLRQASRKKILEICSSGHKRGMLWREPFKQLTNSAVQSQFAEFRVYVYQNREIDRQVHLGYDLAVTAQAPIEAANDGIVVYSDYLGIFGETVIIDHGCGLYTLYGHMSRRRVSPGDKVKRGDIIGNTGTTGLAGGDHLHFTVLLNGIEVNPTEWWDARWLQTHIWNKLKDYNSQSKAALGIQ